MQLVEGADGTSSTSKLQWLLWLAVILFAYVALWVLRAVQGNYSAISNIPVNILTVLGFSTGTAVAAKGITWGYIQNGLVTKTPPPDPPQGQEGAGGGATVGNGGILQDDSGVPELAKIQIMGFTLIGLGIFLTTVVHEIVINNVTAGLPNIDSSLLVLMGISQGGYLGKKLVTFSTQTLYAPNPAQGPAGTKVSLPGVNLGSQPGQLLVNGSPTDFSSWSPTAITFNVPDHDPATVALAVSVMGQTSNAVPFTVTQLPAAAGHPGHGPPPPAASCAHHGPFGRNGFDLAGHDRRQWRVLLTITTTRAPATDLGYLLHKHPDRVQAFATAAGTAHVFYPEATPQRCTAALLLEVDPVALVRGPIGKNTPNTDGELAQYVNDRPYAASSMLAVALKEAFRTALTGRCDARPGLAASRIPLSIRVPALRCRGGSELATQVFEPLGWAIETDSQLLQPPEWGTSPYVDLRLTGEQRLADALNHLYVLLPVLDDAKHYWVSTEEVDKLIRAGGDWLAGHPARDLIVRRYVSHQRTLTRSALARLAEADDTEPEELDNAVTEDDEPRRPLATQRREAIVAILRGLRVRRIGDFGCGAGVLIKDLLADPAVEQVTAVDVSARALQLAARNLRLDRWPDRQRERLRIFQSALTYTDDRLAGLDAAVLMEVIEHVDPERLPALERAVFGFAAPATVIVTTPNAEYNPYFSTLPAGALRHRDHRFEWTRAEFGAWAQRVAESHHYQVRFLPVGPEHPDAGPPTQLAVFTRQTPP
ncbi:MAG TPA: 3' terminal RNA ribose 2'-O-methyltransferase Hen1 [Streptosporangiaceae bacterium]|nr:3' terminal RNA ribose 2'-O-methyltransferase Hen1 [Streptosporangiaceae bacterium]